MSSPAHPATSLSSANEPAGSPVGSRIPHHHRIPDPTALPPGTRLGEYTIEQVLGEGGFGIVYRAFDSALQRHVAIKEYMPATLARRLPDLQITVSDEQQRRVYQAGLDGFLGEARNLAQFDHPALVKVHRFWLANGTAYMVMPFYEGTTLKDALSHRAEPPTEAWLMDLLDALTDALDVVHAQHVLHRDIAPDNILLRPPDGKPLLLDFGAARQVIGDATQRLTAILKPGYAPIEQYGEVASLRQGPWTDVYALCAVMYLAMAGRKPPPAVGRVVTDAYEPLAGMALAGRFSVPFCQAIDQGLRLRPDERLSSMKALRVALGLPTGAMAMATDRHTMDLDILLAAEPDLPEVDLPLDDLRPATATTPPQTAQPARPSMTPAARPGGASSRQDVPEGELSRTPRRVSAQLHATGSPKPGRSPWRWVWVCVVVAATVSLGVMLWRQNRYLAAASAAATMPSSTSLPAQQAAPASSRQA